MARAESGKRVVGFPIRLKVSTGRGKVLLRWHNFEMRRSNDACCVVGGERYGLLGFPPLAISTHESFGVF